MSDEEAYPGPVSPTEKLRRAMEDQGWGPEELAWLLDLPIELADHLTWEVRISPTLFLRLEAALAIPTHVWFAAARMPTPDLWLTAEAIEAELVQIRRRRHLLLQCRQREEGGGGPCP